jgi:hypothetical protein
MGVEEVVEVMEVEVVVGVGEAVVGVVDNPRRCLPCPQRMLG